jgi:hypothetical protein
MCLDSSNDPSTIERFLFIRNLALLKLGKFELLCVVCINRLSQ